MIPRLHLPLLLPAAVLPAFRSCTRDTRPLDTQLSEAISDGLRKHGVKESRQEHHLPAASGTYQRLFMFWDNQKIWDDLIAYLDNYCQCRIFHELFRSRHTLFGHS